MSNRIIHFPAKFAKFASLLAMITRQNSNNNSTEQQRQQTSAEQWR